MQAVKDFVGAASRAGAPGAAGRCPLGRRRTAAVHQAGAAARGPLQGRRGTSSCTPASTTTTPCRRSSSGSCDCPNRTSISAFAAAATRPHRADADRARPRLRSFSRRLDRSSTVIPRRLWPAPWPAHRRAYRWPTSKPVCAASSRRSPRSAIASSPTTSLRCSSARRATAVSEPEDGKGSAKASSGSATPWPKRSPGTGARQVARTLEPPGAYYFCTVHRAENTDVVERLRRLVAPLAR